VLESLSLAWQACFEQAWLAYCAGTVPIGALVTDANGQILSQGRNRIFDKQGEGGYLYGQTLAHAEINALITLDVGRAERYGCTLYTTVEPCPLCMGAFYMSSVRELRYATRDPRGGSTNLLGTTPYLSLKPVKVFGPENAGFEVVNMALNAEYFLHKWGGDAETALADWETVVPQGVALGRKLHRTGELRRMKETGSEAEKVLHWLDTLYNSSESP